MDELDTIFRQGVLQTKDKKILQHGDIVGQTENPVVASIIVEKQNQLLEIPFDYQNPNSYDWGLAKPVSKSRAQTFILLNRPPKEEK